MPKMTGRRWTDLVSFSALRAPAAALLLAFLAALLPAAERTGERLIWIPLDSRPVSTEEVALLGRAGGLQVVMPPLDILDWYANRRGDRTALLQWLQRISRPGDQQVLFTNSLLAGGLIASRDAAAYGGLEGRLRELERTLRRLPSGRRIAVHVLPRALPTQFRSDGSPDPDYRWAELLVARGEWQQRVALSHEPADRRRLAALERLIPAEVLSRADALAQRNLQVLRALLAWVREGLLSDVVVGIDDAQPYGMANLQLHWAGAEAGRLGVGARVHLHYGADEIGFLMLAREAAQRRALQPVLAVEWDTPQGRAAILPYEAVPLERSVAQKIEFLGARVHPAARQRLYIHTAAAQADPGAAARQAEQITAAIRSDAGVTVVDVTGAAERDQVFIQRLRKAAPLARVSYSAWNTASNSVGTGLAMAVFKQLHVTRGASPAEAEAFLAFEAIRYGYDLVFQGEKIALRRWAEERGLNPVRFGEGRAAMDMRLAGVGAKVDALLSEVLHGRQVMAGGHRYIACMEGARLSFPWDRLFEVRVQPFVRLVRGRRCPTR